MFKEIEVEICNKVDGKSLIEEYAKLSKIYADLGDEHGHTIVCQIYSHKTNRHRFFLTGRVLNVEETAAFAKILDAKAWKPRV